MFFGLNLIPWIIASALLVAGGLYVRHCEQVKEEQARFIAELRAQSQEQERKNQERAEKEKAAKEKADEAAKRNLDNLHRTIARLRDEASTGASLVPAAAACAGSTEIAAFDRSELDRTLRNFTAGVSSLIGEGEQAVIELDAAKGWALKLSMELKSGG